MKEVANAVGVAEATVQRWESGNIESIRTDKLTKLSVILQLTMEELTSWFNKETEWKTYDSNADLEKICSEVEITKCIQELYGMDTVQLFSKLIELNESERSTISDLLFGYCKLAPVNQVVRILQIPRWEWIDGLCRKVESSFSK